MSKEMSVKRKLMLVLQTRIDNMTLQLERDKRDLQHLRDRGSGPLPRYLRERARYLGITP
jgi:hypothetical protein